MLHGRLEMRDYKTGIPRTIVVTNRRKRSYGILKYEAIIFEKCPFNYTYLRVHDRNIFGSSSVIFGNLRKISGNLRKMCGNVRSGLWTNFGKIFGKWLEIFGKSPQTSLCIVNIFT